MEKEKFTQEQIEIAKKLYDEYSTNDGIGVGFIKYLDSFLKPKTKKIMVEIEYPENGMSFSEKELYMVLTSNEFYKSCDIIKVGIIPEAFKKEELYEMFAECMLPDTVDTCCDNFISERDKDEE